MNTENILIPYLLTLLEDGFEVVVWEKEQQSPTWAVFAKNGKLGYVQKDYFGGLSFSSIHKPNTLTGTGYGIFTMVDGELSHAYTTLNGRPSWALGDSNAQRYSGLSEYVAKAGLKYVPFMIKEANA